MVTIQVEDQIAEINRKLSVIAEELTRQRECHQPIDDLGADLALVNKDLCRTAVAELDEFARSFRPGELAFLLRTLLRNTANLAQALEQLESVRDLVADFQLIGREVYKDAVAKAGELEQKGYFQFASKASGLLDALVMAHSPQDLEQARASIPHLVEFLRQLTRPEVLQALEAIVDGFGEVQAIPKKDVSAFQLLRELNAPEARRGLAIIIKFLSVIGASTSAPGATNPSKQNAGKE